MENTAVLLLAHGSPDSIEDIPAYLRNVVSGRELPQAVIDEVSHRFHLIGRSPLKEITLKQAKALQRSIGIPVYVGMRNWKPYIADTVREMREAGIHRVVAIPLAPQNSRTSVGLYKRAALAEAGAHMRLEVVESWHDNPLLVRAFAARLRPALATAAPDAVVLFTAHSVPSPTIEAGDPYEAQAKETAALVARETGLQNDQWVFAFQSQGMSGGAWIGPTVEEIIERLRGEERTHVVVQTVGFVCDHVEVLYDVDIAFRQFAALRGMTLTRAESLNDSPEFIAALSDLALPYQKKLDQPAAILSAQAEPPRG